MSSKFIPIKTEGMTPEKGGPAADRIMQGTPESRTWNLYTSADGKFFSGIWESTPGAWRIHYTEDEFCHILEGVSRITEDGGETITLQKGDAFVIAAGFNGIWEVVETTRKQYAIYEA